MRQGSNRSARNAAFPARGSIIVGTALACALFLGAPALAQGLFGGRQSNEAELTVRIDQLEAQIRTLTGQVEQYQHRIGQLEDSLRRFQEDAEFRFRELGAKGSDSGRGTGSAAMPPPLMPAPQPRSLPQPPTYGGIKPLAPPGPDYPPAAAPLDISPPRLGGSEPLPLGSGNPADVALGVPADPRTAYDVAYAFVLQRDYEAAQSAFNDFLARYPDDELAPDAQYWLGESHYAQGQYREAADAFLTVYRRYKSSNKAPDGLLKLAKSLQALGEKEAACASYAEFGRTFPKASTELKNQVRSEQKGAGC
jgi:tol-pal system protein YbgF